MLNLEEIKRVSHIAIVCDNDSFCRASALYTYVLQQHKKVSLLSSEVLDVRFDSVAWYDKVRYQEGSSKADLTIAVEGLDLFKIFEEHEISLNQKMLDALCADLLWQSKHRSPAALDGIYFASLSALIQRGANYTKYAEALLCREPLSKMRLQGVMQQKMVLKNGATEAEIILSDDDLDATGASLKEADEIAQEILRTVHLSKVVLKYNTKEKEFGIQKKR